MKEQKKEKHTDNAPQLPNTHPVALTLSVNREREREREREKERERERERERESSKERLGCDSGLLLLINSASYKMSTTSHTDRIQRVFNITCVEDIMISRLNPV